MSWSVVWEEARRRSAAFRASAAGCFRLIRLHLVRITSLFLAARRLGPRRRREGRGGTVTILRNHGLASQRVREVVLDGDLHPGVVECEVILEVLPVAPLE